VSITYPWDGALFDSGDYFEVDAVAWSQVAAIQSVSLNWTSPSGTSVFTMNPDGYGGWYISGTLGVTGTRTYSVTATDTAGNTSTSATQTLTVQ
jgi:hypothetical protein